MRDTIWAMNKSEISFDDLYSRISNFIDKADLATHNIVFEFDVEESLKRKVFSSVEGMNIYRIIQEAVNNSIKYSEASKIEVKINKLNQSISISIVDNGKGFDISKVELGNGLNNMKKRAKEIQGELMIVSDKGEGVNVELQLPF